MAVVPTLALPEPLAKLRAEFDVRWRAMAPRERWGLRIALIALGVMLVWFIAVQPALRTLGSAPALLDAQEAQWQQMQRMAGEARELRAVTPISPTQAASALRAASDRLGDHAKLSMQGDRATLTLTGVAAPQLSAWLAEARSGARARPTEAQLTRGPQGFAGTVVVLLPGAP